jgi:hypothetical protein
MEIVLNKYTELIKTLPPVVAAVVWDVVNGRISQSTVDLAQATSKEEFEQYDIVRCVVAVNPNYPPLELAMGLVDEMVETAVVAR